MRNRGFAASDALNHIIPNAWIQPDFYKHFLPAARALNLHTHKGELLFWTCSRHKTYKGWDSCIPAEDVNRYGIA